MNRNRIKNRKKRIIPTIANNDSRFIEIHRRLVKLNLLKKLPAFTTKKYDSRDYFRSFEYTSLHNMSIKQACIISRLQGKRYPSPEQVMKCCRKSSPPQMIDFVNTAL